MKFKLSMLFALVIISSGCYQPPRNTVWEQYHSKMKHIEPGFHMLGGSNNTYRLKYVGEKKSSVESARDIWLDRANQICVDSNKSIKETKGEMKETKKTVIKGVRTNSNNIVFCIITGDIVADVANCLVAEIVLSGYAGGTTEQTVGKYSKYPEIEGTINCTPAKYESNKILEVGTTHSGTP